MFRHIKTPSLRTGLWRFFLSAFRGVTGRLAYRVWGLRAVGSTGDFIINTPVSPFINAAGIESPGLSASPAIAEYITELLKKQGLDLCENKSFNPIRPSMHAFRDASIEEKNEIIKKDASFGRIVCRCETVTEGEILEAIRRNPKARDLDGVKRRTRAQMGRCQGGFCGPYITELLARELNVPFEEVTKSGENSYINIGKTKDAEYNDCFGYNRWRPDRDECCTYTTLSISYRRRPRLQVRRRPIT